MFRKLHTHLSGYVWNIKSCMMLTKQRLKFNTSTIRFCDYLVVFHGTKTKDTFDCNNLRIRRKNQNSQNISVIVSCSLFWCWHKSISGIGFSIRTYQVSLKWTRNFYYWNNEAIYIVILFELCAYIFTFSRTFKTEAIR